MYFFSNNPANKFALISFVSLGNFSVTKFPMTLSRQTTERVENMQAMTHVIGILAEVILIE
jgi:hypothetical protein